MKLSTDPQALKVTAGLVLTGLVLFGASFNDPFHFDDTLITTDSNVTNAERWPHFLNPLHLRQLTFFTFYLNHLVVGVDPSGYHVANVVLHISNAVLLFLLLGRFIERWIAIAAAAVFLVHPIQTQPVLYVYERSALLGCFFSLLALMALSRGRRWMALLLFFLAFESKESSLAVPLAVALLGRKSALSAPEGRRRSAVSAPEGRQSVAPGASPGLTNDLDVQPRRGERFGAESSAPPGLAARETDTPGLRPGLHSDAPPGLQGLRSLFYPLLISAVAFGTGALALFAYWGERTVGLTAGLSPLRYFLTQTRVVYTYLRLLVFPYPQSLEYEFAGGGGILPILGIVLILAAGWRLRKSIPGLCILAFFVFLAPTSSIIPSADAAFEHRLYLPMLAFSLMTGYFISRLPRRSWVAIPLVAVLGALTVSRGTVWSSEISLWEDTVKRAPGKARVWFNLAGAYLEREPEKARSSLLRAIELQPHFPQAYYDLGIIEQGRGNWNTALAYYGRAVEQDAAFWPAWNNLGNTMFSMGQGERAVEYFERTLSLNRDYWPAQYNIAIVHFISGRYTDAEPRLRTVLDWRPDFREARELLALTLTRAGNRASADAEWKKLGELHAAESRITPTMILAPNRP